MGMLARESVTSGYRLREGGAGVGLEPQQLPVRSDPLALRRRHGLGRETRGLRERGYPAQGPRRAPRPRALLPLPSAGRARALPLPDPAQVRRCQWRGELARHARPPGRRVRSGTGKRGRLSHPERQAFPEGAQGVRGGRLVRCGGEGVEGVCGEPRATTGFYLRIWRGFSAREVGGWRGRAGGGMSEKPSIPHTPGSSGAAGGQPLCLFVTSLDWVVWVPDVLSARGFPRKADLSSSSVSSSRVRGGGAGDAQLPTPSPLPAPANPWSGLPSVKDWCVPFLRKRRAPGNGASNFFPR